MTSISSKVNHTLQQSSPIIMGIVNATSDSFYDGGHLSDEPLLVWKLKEFNESGVDIIDIGGESSQPGSTPISSEEEIKRLSRILPIVREMSDALISIDTYKPEVAAFALNEGAHIINDITAGDSTELLETVAKHDAGIILMHKKGTPKTMQASPTYTDVIREVKDYLYDRINLSQSYGINTIIVDPGIGFGKTLEDNLLILKNIDSFKELDAPILLGTSNKSFIEHLTGASINDRVPGSIASALATYQKGASIFRVHNVKETIQAFNVFNAIYE